MSFDPNIFSKFVKYYCFENKTKSGHIYGLANMAVNVTDFNEFTNQIKILKCANP